MSTKTVLGPTPEVFRPTSGPDPGYLNGKAFSKQILALRNNGSLRVAGLTPEHVQTLQNIGTLLERGNVPESKINNLIQALSTVSKKVSGAQWVVSKLMTSPKAAAAIESALKSPASVGTASKAITSAFGIGNDDDSNNSPTQNTRPSAASRVLAGSGGGGL